MKLIAEGRRRQEVWEGRWECLHCKRLIELEQGDDELVLAVHSDQREETTITMDCPVCGKETTWYKFHGKIELPVTSPPVHINHGSLYYPEGARGSTPRAWAHPEDES